MFLHDLKLTCTQELVLRLIKAKDPSISIAPSGPSRYTIPYKSEFLESKC
jgi:hypothetical protein